MGGVHVRVCGGKGKEGRGGRSLTRKESQQRNLLELLKTLSQNQLEGERGQLKSELRKNFSVIRKIHCYAMYS